MRTQELALSVIENFPAPSAARALKFATFDLSGNYCNEITGDG